MSDNPWAPDPSKFVYRSTNTCGYCLRHMSWWARNWPLWRRYEGRWEHFSCTRERQRTEQGL